MKKTNHFLVAGILLLYSLMLVSAAEDHQELFLRAQEIINNKTSCNVLTEADLEALGEYFMEQMHPGEAHEFMDGRMGGEGSETLRQAHVNMGSRFYCGSTYYTNTQNYGMMGSGMGMMQGSMYYYSGSQMGYWFVWWIIAILFILILILTIILLLKKINEKGGRKR